MRGRLTDQDLTDYALNELPPDERLYVESMLGVSEECRHDVYQMLELSEMLKDGLERESTQEVLALSPEQRTRLLDVPVWNWRSFLNKAAAILLLSVGTAFIATRPGIWQKTGISTDRLASAGQAVQGMVADMHEKGFARSVEEFRTRLEMTSAPVVEAAWQFASEPAVCTPPVWVDMPLADIAEM